MWPASIEALAALKAGHQRTWRLVQLEPATLDPIDYFEGQNGIVVQMNVSAVRKRRNRYTVTGSIVDPLGTLPWTRPGDPFFPETPWRADAGVKLSSGSWEWIPQATFLIRDPDGGNLTLSFSGGDAMSLGDLSGFTRPETIPKGTRASRAIQDLCIGAGLGDDPGLYDFEDGGRLVDSDLPCERGEYRLEKAAWIAERLGLELYSSREGKRTLRPMVTVPPEPSWDFVRGSSSTFASARRRVGIEDLYNHTLIEGHIAGQLPVYGEARDMNPASPVYNPPPGHADYPGAFGDRVYPVEVSSIIGDVVTATERAKALLLEVALITEDISYDAIPTLVLDPGDVVRTTDQRIDADALDSWLDEVVTSSSLGETQSLRSRQVRSLLAA